MIGTKTYAFIITVTYLFEVWFLFSHRSVDFEDDTVGMAIPDAVCTGRASGISKMPNFLEPQQGATTLSHMIGHNLGIKHDEDSKYL